MAERWTERQYLTALAWLDGLWNEPDRTDHYLMQIAAECRRAVAKNPKSVHMKDMRIPFVERGAEPRSAVSREQAAAAAKARWGARLFGKAPRVVTGPKEA